MGGQLAAERFEDEAAGDGVVIAGRYELGSQLGNGGMGVVWRGRDRRLARAVAVKVLSQSSVGSDVARTRLIREARAAAALEHEGIIRVYDVGETDDGGAFLVMELIRGRSLRAVLEMRAMKLGSRVSVIVQAARALHFAHEAGIVHRDVKPDNIMIRDDGRVTVVDFGVAKPLSAELAVIAGTVAGTPPSGTLTGPGQLVGTPAYLAPEQARGLDVTAATDQFALAITAFEALTDKRPWTAACFSDVIASLLRDAPLRVSAAAPLPPELDEVFERALAKEPRDRYPDIGAFADALEDAAVSLEVDEPVSSRAGSRRATPISLRGASVVERASAPDADKDDPVTSPLISSTDARPTPAIGRGRLRYALAAALAVAVAVLALSRRTKEPVGAALPTAPPPSAVVTQAELPTPPPPPPSAVATATITPATPTSEPSSAPHVASVGPVKERKPSVPSTVSAPPLSATSSAMPVPSTSSVAPAPKSTGRRIRTEL